jgi:hypothetical protein
MANEMKLITALCERLGFEVEKVCVNKEEIVNYVMATFFDVKPIYEYKLTTPIVKVETVEEPFTKLKENDEIFNTEMFGEVRISRYAKEEACGSYGMLFITSIKNGNYFDARLEDLGTASCIIKAMDKMYIERGKA